MILKKQAKILTLIGIVAAFFVIFVFFIYLPASRQLSQLRSQFLRLEAEVDRVKVIAGEKGSLEGAIISLRRRNEILNNKFPEKEETALRELSSLSTSMGIGTSSVRPQRKRNADAINGQPVGIRGFVVQEMTVSLDMRTNYKKLGDFLKVLKEGFPVFIKIEKVQMVKAGGEKDANLKIDLELKIYLASPQNS